MKTKYQSTSESILAISLVLAFVLAALFCFYSMLNVVDHVSEGVHKTLVQANSYATSLSHK